MVANTFAETVAQTILKQLEKGLAPWTRPWEPGERFLPYNPTTGNTYKGINSLWLLGVAEDKGFSDNRWMTYKQADSLNGQVNKGEKGTLIQFWQWQDQVLKTDDMDKPVHDEDGHPLKITVQLQKPKVRSAVVFNAEQITIGACNYKRSCLQTREIPARIKCNWGAMKPGLFATVLENEGTCLQLSGLCQE